MTIKIQDRLRAQIDAQVFSKKTLKSAADKLDEQEALIAELMGALEISINQVAGWYDECRGRGIEDLDEMKKPIATLAKAKENTQQTKGKDCASCRFDTLPRVDRPQCGECLNLSKWEPNQ